jgi:hypothetical protein
MAFSIVLNEFFCPNEFCADHGKKGRGNIAVCDRYGKERRLLLRCKTCNFRFSERRNTFFFGLHTDDSKIREVIGHLIQGMSFRETADISDLDKDTVQRIWKRFVEYCEESVGTLLTEFNIKLEDLILLLHRRIPKR